MLLAIWVFCLNVCLSSRQLVADSCSPYRCQQVGGGGGGGGGLQSARVRCHPHQVQGHAQHETGDKDLIRLVWFLLFCLLFLWEGMGDV